MKNPIADIQIPDAKYRVSLAKLTGVPISDITGYITKEFGEPMFKLSTVVFANGETVWVEGEHDLAYIAEDLPKTSRQELGEVYTALNGDS